MQFTDRIPQYGSYSMVVLKNKRTRNSSWKAGDLRAQFTDRISVYGPYSISYLTNRAVGRKSGFWKLKDDEEVYGP